MAFILSSENVLEYLKQQGICQPDQELIAPVEPNEYKNFNLIVNVTGNKHYLVKQERFDGNGKASGCLKYESISHQFLSNFSELKPIQSSISEIVHFDPENSIIVINYLPEYISLSEFYRRKNDYPTEIASLLGANLAQVHRLTFEKQEYRDFLRQHAKNRSSGETPKFMRGLERIGPGIFSNVCRDGIEFFKLYQRFSSLHQAVAELHSSYQATCLTHNDPRFSNYLIEDLIEDQDSASILTEIKLIDWEFFEWGDPAYDLGVLISKYLGLWLDSLFVNSDTDLNLSLSLATCPLEKVQPSLASALQSYLSDFPEILEVRPDFIKRVVQFAGLDLIKHIQHDVEYHKPFHNGNICTLQVAKTLLCYPEQAMSTIFGLTEFKVPATV